MKKKILNILIILLLSTLIIIININNVYAVDELANITKEECKEKLDGLKYKIESACSTADWYRTATDQELEQLRKDINDFIKYKTRYTQFTNWLGASLTYDAEFSGKVNGYIELLNKETSERQENGGGRNNVRPTLGGIISEGNDFISAGEGEDMKLDQDSLKNLSGSIYNILLVLGIIVAVIIGVVLGIKFVTEGVEGKAEVKNALIPYVVGCVIVFGAFAIWKIVVDIMQTM